MTKQQRQQEIFKNFSNGDTLKEIPNNKKRFEINQTNQDNKYFLVTVEPKREWENKLIFEIANDERARFIMKWKVWETTFQTESGLWTKAFVIVLNQNNKWDNEIIQKWEELALGADEIEDITFRNWTINKW